MPSEIGLVNAIAPACARNLDPTQLLDANETCAALRSRGFKISPRTLATYVSRPGDAPPYRKFGHRRLYLWAEVIAWAEGKLTGPRSPPPRGLNHHAVPKDSAQQQ